MRLKKDKSGDTVSPPSWKSSLLGDPGAKFFCGKPQHMKNSLNFANTCLKVVDTRRAVQRLPALNVVRNFLKPLCPSCVCKSLRGVIRSHRGQKDRTLAIPSGENSREPSCLRFRPDKNRRSSVEE